MSKNKDRRWSLRKPELPPEQEVDTSLMDTVQFAAIKTEPEPEVKYAEPAPAAESAPPAEPVSSSLEDELPNWMPEWAAKEPGEPAKDYHYDASAYQEYYEDHPDDPDLSSLNLEKAYEQDQEFRQTFRTRDEFRTNPQYDAAAANAEPRAYAQPEGRDFLPDRGDRLPRRKRWKTIVTIVIFALALAVTLAAFALARQSGRTDDTTSKTSGILSFMTSQEPDTVPKTLNDALTTTIYASTTGDASTTKAAGGGATHKPSGGSSGKTTKKTKSSSSSSATTAAEPSATEAPTDPPTNPSTPPTYGDDDPGDEPT